MPIHDIIVVGASAGGLPALTSIVKDLPTTLRAAVLIILHTSASSNGLLPKILSRTGALPVAFANDFDRLERGRIYVARPDFHLLIADGGVRVVHGPTENGFRPAIDPLFRTAARTYGSRVIGVVLSGALSDGAYGLAVIKQHGGIAIVQDPDDAVIDSMPRSALRAVDVDYVLPASEIAATLDRLSRTAAEGDAAMAVSKDLEPQLPSEETEVAAMEERYGAPTPLTCPDCGGSLWHVTESGVVRYQCHVGHQYAEENLVEEQRAAVDSALWSAVRILEEQAALKMRMANRATAGGLVAVSEGFAQGARDAHQHAQEIRAVLFASGNDNKQGTSSQADVAPDRAPRRPRVNGAKRPRRRTRSKRKT